MTLDLPRGPATVASPGASIERRRGCGHGATIFTVTGPVGRGDAAVLSRCLHAELDARPAVLVVDIRAVTTCDPVCDTVLAVVRSRTRALGVGFHLLDDPAVLASSTPVGAGRVHR